MEKYVKSVAIGKPCVQCTSRSAPLEASLRENHIDMKMRKGDRQYYLNKEGDTFRLVKRVKTFSKSATLGKTKATVKTVADIIFREEEFGSIDFTQDGLREGDKEIISMMLKNIKRDENGN